MCYAIVQFSTTCPGCFIGSRPRPKGRKLRPKAESGVGRHEPSPPARGPGSTVSCPSGVLAEPRPLKGFPLFSALRMLSPDTIIVNYPVAIGGGGKTPVSPPLHTPRQFSHSHRTALHNVHIASVPLVFVSPYISTTYTHDNAPPPFRLPHLFCGAGHEKRRGEQLKWSLAFSLYIEVFHVHSYQDQFIQPSVFFVCLA